MALEKIVKEDKIELVDMGDWKNIQVRTATIIREDGKMISRNFHRHVVNPNSDLTNQSDEVKKLAEIYFTDDAKAAHKKANDTLALPNDK